MDEVVFSETAESELIADLTAATTQLEISDSPFHRRSLIRTFFAYVEARAYGIRQKSLHSLNEFGWGDREISLFVFPFLSEMTAALSQTGKIEYQDTKFPFARLVAFSLRSYAEVRELEGFDPFSHHGWERFQEATRIRHRLTHPKQARDIKVGDADLITIREGRRWIEWSIRWIEEGARPEWDPA